MILQAERLARAGFAIHWLHPRSKRPIGKDWSEKPVLSAEKLRATYRDDYNVGVRLGEWSVIGGMYLHIVDVDIRVDEYRDAAFAKLKEVFPELDTTKVPEVISGSGGESRHFYILSDRAFPSRKFAHSPTSQYVWDETREKDVKKWDWELHLLGTGAQAVIPPSIHPDTKEPYKWVREFDLDDAALGLVDVIPASVLERVTGYEQASKIDPERLKPIGLSVEEIHGVLSDLPFEDWFEDRAGWVNTGMAIHHEMGGSEEGFNLWCEYARKSAKFDLEDSRRVWRSFKNRNERPFRMASLVAVAKDERMMRDFDDMPDVDDFDEQDSLIDDMFADILGESAGAAAPKKKLSKSQARLKKEQTEIDLGRGAPEWVRKLNKKHAVARVSGKTIIMDFAYDGKVHYGSVNDLHNLYENDRRPKEDTTVPVSKLWMQHQQRRTYPNGIVFLPNRHIEGTYNHWQGFSVEPDPNKSCKWFLHHLKEVFCAGNEEHYRYMLGWLAHMVQKPEEKPGVAIIARGEKRIGKDTPFLYISKMIENHYVTVSEKSQMVGKFNAHQEKVLLLHMQEGFWGGNKQDESALKYMITSETVMIEPKGVNAFPVKSCLRLYISSNERWVVPATEDEGRFLVLEVSKKHQKDHAYFAKIYEEMDNGGPAALLHYLMNYDISNFQVRNVPDSEALAEQKIEGLRNIEKWWLEVLQSGSVYDQQYGDLIDQDEWEKNVMVVDKQRLRAHYANWMHGRRYSGEVLSDNAFTKRLQVMAPRVDVTRRRIGGSRANVFIIPNLHECREGFQNYLGSTFAWPAIPQFVEHVDDKDDDL